MKKDLFCRLIKAYCWYIGFLLLSCSFIWFVDSLSDAIIVFLVMAVLFPIMALFIFKAFAVLFDD